MKSNLPARRLIPKWRPVATSLRTPDAVPIPTARSRPLLGDREEFEHAVKHWRQTKTPGALGDVLSFGVCQNLVEEVAALGYTALRTGAALTSVQQMLIQDIGKHQGLIPAQFEGAVPSSDNLHPLQAPIRAVRALLKSAPDNALALLDYAQFQAAVGRMERAERAIRTALSLRPDNRLVLRTAARFFVHAGKPDVGHTLIRRHARTAADPWLMASEIALADAAKTQSQFLGRGKRFLFDHKKAPAAQITELAGAVSMAELASGNLKRARETQRQALLAPNDNVIAQAVELRSKLGLQLEGVTIERAMAASSEARVLQAWIDAAPDDVATYSREWHVQEPFSSRPVQMLSTLYAFQGDHEMALRWIRAGLLADPDDQGLLINLAYVQVLRRDYVAASEVLRKQKSTKQPEFEPFTLATEGLMAYQLGLFAAGDQFYSGALAVLEKSRRPEVLAYCLLNQALAARDCQHPHREALRAKASTALKGNTSPDSAMLLKVRGEQQTDASATDEMSGRRLSQWVFDPKSNSLVERMGVTSVGAKGLIVRISGPSNER
jgi:tetratricopeptide (TPR) repeat protein